MKNLPLLILLLLCQFSNAQKKEVRQVIDTFFEGFHARDTAKLHSVCSARLMLQSVNDNKTNAILSDESAEDFYKSIVSLPALMKFQEKLLDCEIRLDGSMAQVWAPYEFYIDGKFSHKGVDAFTLLRESGQWKIIYLIDTRRK